MLKTILIGVLICIFTKTDINKGIIYGAICGFIGNVSDIFLSNILFELPPQINTIIYAPMLGFLISVLTKTDVIKGIIYGVFYSAISYMIASVIDPLSDPFQFDFIIYRLIETLANYYPSIHYLIHSILTYILFSLFISMLITSKAKYIARSVLAGIIYAISSNLLNINDIIVRVIYVNYLFFILYPLTLQKTDVVATMTTNDSTYTTTYYNPSAQLETEQELQKDSKIKWGYVISRTLIGAFIGTIIVYIAIMITPNSGGSFGFFTNMKSFFALIIAVIYGGSGGAIIGFIVALCFPKIKANSTDKNL